MARDVELVIKAKDAATKAIDSIKDALKDLSGVQEDVGKSAAKTDNLLGELARQLSTLNAEAKGLSALGTVAGELEKAGTAVSKLEVDVRKSAAEFAKLARDTEAASVNANKLRGALEAERNALKGSQDARKQANDQLREANRQVKEAEANQKAYNRALEKAPAPPKPTKGVGIEAGAPISSARESYGVFAAAGLTSAINAQAELKQAVAEFDAEINRSKQAIKTFEVQVGSAAEQERKLSRETEKVSGSLARNREDLFKGRAALGEMSTAANAAGASFGGLALNQDKVAQASARMAAEVARTQARLDTLSRSQTKAVAPSGDRRAVLESRRDFMAAQEEVKRLADEMRRASAPTAEMGAALGRAQAAARLAAEAYEANRAAAARLKTEQGSLSAFLQRTASDQQRAANAFVSAQAQIARGTTQVTTAAAAASRALPPIAAAAKDVDNGLKQATGGASSFRDVMRSVGGEGRTTLSLFQRIRGEALSLTAAFVGLYGVANQIGQVLSAFQTVEAAQSRLGVVFNGDTARVGQELDFIARQAQRLGVTFGVLSEQYSKFAVAAQAANFTSQATRDIFLSVAEAGRVNKLSADQLNGVFLALTQMISKGKVTAEELRGQLGERLTGAFNIFADAIGVTTAELDEMMKKGEVIANQNTLLKFAEQLDKRFGSQLSNSLKGTTAEIGRFFDNLFQAQVRVGEGGFIEGFTNALRDLNGYFQSREGRDFFLAVGAALGRAAEAAGFLIRNLDLVSGAVKVLIGLKLASYFTSIVAEIRKTQGSFTGFVGSFYNFNGAVAGASTQVAAFAASGGALSGTVGALRSQLVGAATGFALLTANSRLAQATLTGLRVTMVAVAGTARLMWTAIGGIPGLILTGITFALGSWLSSVKDTTSAADEHKRIIGEIVSKYEEAKNKTADWAKEIRGASTIQVSLEIDKAQANLKELRDAVKAPVDTFRLDTRGTVRAVQEAVTAFKSGASTAADFKKRINEIAESDPKLNRNLVAQLLATADQAIETEAGIAKLAATLRLLKGEATDADKVLLGLKEATDGAGESMRKSAQTDAKAFSDALKEIKGLVPEIADEMKRLGEIEALDKQYQAAAKLARTMSEIVELNKNYDAALKGINERYASRAISSDISGSGTLVDKIVGIESGGDPYAKNDNSSATGLGQFIEKTWLNLFKKYFPDRAESMSREAILALRNNAKISRDMIALYAKENAAVLQDAGVAVTEASLYLSHFLGPGGAVKVLTASASTPVSELLGADQIDKNRSILQGKTAGQVAGWAEGKVGMSKEQVTLQRDVAEAEQKRVEKAREYNTELDNRLSLQAQENANGGKLTREAFIQKQLAEEQKRARAADVILTDEQIAKVKELAGQEYDIANAKREGKTATQEANVALQQAVALNAQRNELQKQFNIAQRTGDSTGAVALQTQLADVNLKLQEAIDKARGMWQAIGGEQADVALTKLDTLKAKTTQSTSGLNMLGLSTQQVGQLAGSFADGFAGALDDFAQAVANGENAVQALGRAFLQFAANFLREIAMMIIKQQVLNAVQAIGKAFGAGPIPTGHTGGVVGSTGIGLGNNRKRVSPALFAGAMRYHTGGVVGLRPNEVPAVLKQGEEVLTENDPRHRNNAGTAPAVPMPSTIRNILVMDEASALNHLNSSSGEAVILSHVKKNAATIKRMLG